MDDEKDDGGEHERLDNLAHMVGAARLRAPASHPALEQHRIGWRRSGVWIMLRLWRHALSSSRGCLAMHSSAMGWAKFSPSAGMLANRSHYSIRIRRGQPE